MLKQNLIQECGAGLLKLRGAFQHPSSNFKVMVGGPNIGPAVWETEPLLYIIEELGGH
jgi:hypothetical protein